jgi:hypothetical protein
VLEHDPVIRLIGAPDRILWLVLAQWMEPHDFIATVPDVRFAVLGLGDLLSYIAAMAAHGGYLQRVATVPSIPWVASRPKRAPARIRDNP